jgi:hypothetical protein
MRSEFSMSSQQRLHEAAEWLVSLDCHVSTDDETRKLVVHHHDGMTEQVHRVVWVVDPPAVRKARGGRASHSGETPREDEHRRSC